MSDDIRIEVHGLAELKVKFDKLADDTKTRIANKMVKDGANEIVTLAKANAPVRTGTLRRAIRARKQRSQNKEITTYIVGYTQGKKAKNDAWYGRLVELGTKPHRIPKKGIARLYFRGKFFSSVQHPGAKPHPWLEPAFTAGYMKTINKMSDTFKTMIEAKYNGS
jgi:HK97 gp10 family phage protein